MEGVKDDGTLSPSAGSLTREGMAAEEVVGVGACWGWAFRLQGWVARRIKREESMLDSEEDIDIVGLVFAMVDEEKEERRFEVVTEENTLPEQSPQGGCNSGKKKDRVIK